MTRVARALEERAVKGRALHAAGAPSRIRRDGRPGVAARLVGEDPEANDHRDQRRAVHPTAAIPDPSPDDLDRTRLQNRQAELFHMHQQMPGSNDRLRIAVSAWKRLAWRCGCASLTAPAARGAAAGGSSTATRARRPTDGRIDHRYGQQHQAGPRADGLGLARAPPAVAGTARRGAAGQWPETTGTRRTGRHTPSHSDQQLMWSQVPSVALTVKHRLSRNRLHRKSPSSPPGILVQTRVEVCGTRLSLTTCDIAVLSTTIDNLLVQFARPH